MTEGQFIAGLDFDIGLMEKVLTMSVSMYKCDEKWNGAILLINPIVLSLEFNEYKKKNDKSHRLLYWK